VIPLLSKIEFQIHERTYFEPVFVRVFILDSILRARREPDFQIVKLLAKFHANPQIPANDFAILDSSGVIHNMGGKSPGITSLTAGQIQSIFR